MTKHFEIESDDERLVVYCEDQHTYGLQDRKVKNCYTPISFCPWCGTSLPSCLPPDEPMRMLKS
jgi:hypothetical protein